MYKWRLGQKKKERGTITVSAGASVLNGLHHYYHRPRKSLLAGKTLWTLLLLPPSPQRLPTFFGFFKMADGQQQQQQFFAASHLIYFSQYGLEAAIDRSVEFCFVYDVLFRPPPSIAILQYSIVLGGSSRIKKILKKKKRKSYYNTFGATE